MLAGIAGFNSAVMYHAYIYLTSIYCTYSMIESILVLGPQSGRRQSACPPTVYTEKKF